MHHAGLLGMPRRIPDYPDCYMELSQMSNIGMVSIVAALILLTILLIDTVSTQVSTTSIDPIDITTSRTIGSISNSEYIRWNARYSGYQDSLITPILLH